VGWGRPRALKGSEQGCVGVLAELGGNLLVILVNGGVEEDAAFTFSPLDFAALDTGGVPDATLEAVKIDNLPASGVLVDNNVNVAAGQIVSGADVYSGLLRYLSPHDLFGVSFAGFTFETTAVFGNVWQGDPEAIDTAPHTITINVASVNDRPTFVPGPDQSVLDTSGPRSIAVWAQQILAGPPNEAGQKVHFEATNDNPSLFLAEPAIDTTGKLTFQPAINESGIAHVMVVAVDDGGTTNNGVDRSPPQTFTIGVSLPEPLHNRQIAADVTGDGEVVADDVIDVINFINASGSGPVAPAKPGDPHPTLYYDVTGDDYIAADDVVTIVNYITRKLAICPRAVPGVTAMFANPARRRKTYPAPLETAARQAPLPQTASCTTEISNHPDSQVSRRHHHAEPQASAACIPLAAVPKPNAANMPAPSSATQSRTPAPSGSCPSQTTAGTRTTSNATASFPLPAHPRPGHKRPLGQSQTQPASSRCPCDFFAYDATNGGNYSWSSPVYANIFWISRDYVYRPIPWDLNRPCPPTLLSISLRLSASV
jgi:hypothetical protein